MKFRTLALVSMALGATVLGATPAIATPAPSSSPAASSSPAQVDAQFQRFAAEHPDDYAAQDAKAMELYGRHTEVWLGDSKTPVTGAQAAKIQNSVQPFAIPTNTFSVSKSATQGSTGVIALGSWKFIGSWAGQEAPVDVASLQFQMSTCHKITSYLAVTANTSGKSTNRGSLRDGGVSTQAPTWNIADVTVGFDPQAATGSVSVIITKGSCKAASQVGYEFRYEANQGGSVVGVSAGFGVLSVSYSGSPSTLQKGTTAGYFNG